MKREEIEKAIDNGKSVWVVSLGNVWEIKPTIKDLQILPTFKDIYKTKAEAEHYLHHANVSRTEELPFLTWEEFDNGDKLIRFKSKNGDYCKLEGYFNKDTNSGFIDVVRNGHCLFSEDYTEENFYKAYDECVRLFGSEE